MKKTLVCLMLIVSMVLSIGMVAFADEKEVVVVLDGKVLEFDQNPVIQNGRTLVPLRGIFEPMGARVGWDDATQTVTAVKDDVTIKLTIGDNILYKNGEAITLDVPAQLIGSRTMVPARAVSEAFDAKVGWIEESWTVTIVTDKAMIEAINKIEGYDKLITRFEYILDLQGIEGQAALEFGWQKTGDKFKFSRTTITIPGTDVKLEEIVATNGIWTYKKDSEGNRVKLDEATDIGIEEIISVLLAECKMAEFVQEQETARYYMTEDVAIATVPGVDATVFVTSADLLGIDGAGGDGMVRIYVYEETGEALRAWYDSMVVE